MEKRVCPKCGGSRLSQKVYVPDFIVEEKIIPEVEGEGSSSKDNEERDRYLESKGYVVKHYANRDVLANPKAIVDDVMTAVALAQAEPEAVSQESEKTTVDEDKLTKAVKTLDSGLGKHFGWLHIFQKVQVKPTHRDLEQAGIAS